MKQPDYIHFRAWACGITDSEVTEAARSYAKNWIDKREAGAKVAAAKLTKLDTPKAIAQRERMRERRRRVK
jgi:hypothetical protein